MSRYYVKPVLTKNEKEVRWTLMERLTDQLIEWSWLEEIVRDRCTFMERGGAFDGFTPRFVLRAVDPRFFTSTDVNDMFQIKFVVEV